MYPIADACLWIELNALQQAQGMEMAKAQAEHHDLAALTCPLIFPQA
jgi:hypothetical protein